LHRSINILNIIKAYLSRDERFDWESCLDHAQGVCVTLGMNMGRSSNPFRTYDREFSVVDRVHVELDTRLVAESSEEDDAPSRQAEFDTARDEFGDAD